MKKKKFELVEFYPAPAANKRKDFIGTVHIYDIKCELDIRGIYVMKAGKKLFFHLPHFFSIEPETGKETRYPHLRFTNEKKHQEMMDFLHKEVTEEILKVINK